MPIGTPTGYLDITNATLRSSQIVTTGYVGIANANPVNHLSVGSNLHINDTHSNVLQISGNINAAGVVLGGISIAPTFDLEIVTNTGNTTPYTVEFNNTATAFVTTANATIGDTLTASKLVGDGSAISAIQSSNVSDFASNVSRIQNLESANMTIDGEKTLSSNLEVGTANLFVDTTTGRVGVGTGSPDGALHVITGGNTGQGLTLQNSDVKTVLSHLPGGNNRGFIQTFSGVTSSIPTSSSTKYPLCLQPYGSYVGIGTDAPSATLHVNGTTLGVPGVYSRGSWNSGTSVTFDLDYNNYNFHRIIVKYRGRTDATYRSKSRVRFKFVGETSFATSGYEAMTWYARNDGNTGFLNNTDGSQLSQYDDQNEDTLAIIDVANTLYQRGQLQFKSSWTWGNVGYTMGIGGCHRNGTGLIDAVKLYLEDYNASNIVTTSAGEYVIIGYK